MYLLLSILPHLFLHVMDKSFVGFVERNCRAQNFFGQILVATIHFSGKNFVPPQTILISYAHATTYRIRL